MEYDNLWDFELSDGLNSTDSIKDILSQQGKYLSKRTDGIVHAKLSKMRKRPFVEVGKVISSVYSDYTDDEETNNLLDANDFYGTQKYGFEIYNKEYKFRAFELLLSPIYPITIDIDYGILEDTETLILNRLEKSSHEHGFLVESEDSFLYVLKIILSSKKVRYIVNRLIQEGKKDKE